MVIEFDAPLLRWGNSYALRITRKQAQQLGARPGTPLHARVEAAGRPELFLPTFSTGEAQTDWSLRHDELALDAMVEEWRSWQES